MLVVGIRLVVVSGQALVHCGVVPGAAIVAAANVTASHVFGYVSTAFLVYNIVPLWYHSRQGQKMYDAYKACLLRSFGRQGGALLLLVIDMGFESPEQSGGAPAPRT